MPKLRNLSYGALVVTLLASACTGDTGESTAPITSVPMSSTTAPSPPVTTTTVPTSTTFPGTAPTTTTLASGVDPEAAAALKVEIDRLVAETEQVRGLSFLTPPDIAIVSNDELGRLVLEEFAESDTTDYAVENALYTLLGMMEPGTDLEAIIRSLLEEQVLGFYDGDTKQLYVGAPEAGLSPLSTLTVVHELVHALTDQHFAFADRFETLLDADEFDEAAALQALVEGDATYYELVYFQDVMTPAQQLSVAQEVLGFDSTAFEASPEFIQVDLQFPYSEGFFFVEELIDAGGSAALDDAYENPPVTTEQVLHPRRYLAGEPELDVTLPETSLPGYAIYEEGDFGEWGLHLLFAGNEGAGLITQLGDGWGGDEYRILSNGTDVAFVLRYQADRNSDAFEVAEALLRLSEEAMGLGSGVASGGGRLFSTAEGFAFLDRVDDVLIFIAATDPEDGAALRAMLAAA